MTRTSALAIAAVLAASITVVGCSNPADDTPAAVVSEPMAQAAPTSAPTSAPTYAPAWAPASAPAAYPAEMQPIVPKLYVVQPQSTISFVGSKVTGRHDGGFKSFTGDIYVVEGDVAQSYMRIVIDTTTLWTDTKKLTGHLQSVEFFDVATYPTAVFESVGITRDGDHYTVRGNLTLHGITKGITFPATIQVSDTQVTTSAEFHINRFDFGIVYPGKANDLIRKEVVLKFDLVATPA